MALCPQTSIVKIVKSVNLKEELKKLGIHTEKIDISHIGVTFDLERIKARDTRHTK